MDTDFLDPANWTGGDASVLLPGAPRAVDTYIVGADAVLSGAAAVNGVLAVGSGASLTVAGKLTIADTGTPDWEYRTFILDDETLPVSFLRVGVGEGS